MLTQKQWFYLRIAILVCYVGLTLKCNSSFTVSITSAVARKCKAFNLFFYKQHRTPFKIFTDCGELHQANTEAFAKIERYITSEGRERRQEDRNTNTEIIQHSTLKSSVFICFNAWLPVCTDKIISNHICTILLFLDLSSI